MTAEGPSRSSAPVVVSKAMTRLFKTVDRLASSVIPVLILGETGTGKEVVAREIHDRGGRAKRPMICINCGGIPEHLVEGTLFGHERGAFTGADKTSKGIFESAHGGQPVFLDEVGELPLSAQAALLRVLETGKLTPGGLQQGDRGGRPGCWRPPTRIWSACAATAPSVRICFTGSTP